MNSIYKKSVFLVMMALTTFSFADSKNVDAIVEKAKTEFTKGNEDKALQLCSGLREDYDNPDFINNYEKCRHAVNQIDNARKTQKLEAELEKYIKDNKLKEGYAECMQDGDKDRTKTCKKIKSTYLQKAGVDLTEYLFPSKTQTKKNELSAKTRSGKATFIVEYLPLEKNVRMSFTREVAGQREEKYTEDFPKNPAYVLLEKERVWVLDGNRGRYHLTHKGLAKEITINKFFGKDEKLKMNDCIQLYILDRVRNSYELYCKGFGLVYRREEPFRGEVIDFSLSSY